MNTKFTAKECNIQGILGYIVKQYNDDKCVCEQFVSNDAFGKYQKYLASEGHVIEIIETNPR